MSAARTLAANNKAFAPVLPGFECINRYWDRQRDIVAAKILPGEYYVTRQPELITTVLGSCVSACVRDPVAGIGGMNHFMLPMHKDRLSGSLDAGLPARYGNIAMEQLINELLKYGARRENLEVKVFGGGQILETMGDIGAQNIGFVRRYLATQGLRILAEDLGGSYPRKIVYLPQSGRAFVKRLHTLRNETLITRELDHIRALKNQASAGKVEIV